MSQIFTPDELSELMVFVGDGIRLAQDNLFRTECDLKRKPSELMKAYAMYQQKRIAMLRGIKSKLENHQKDNSVRSEQHGELSNEEISIIEQQAREESQAGGAEKPAVP